MKRADTMISPPNHPTQYNMNVPKIYLIMSKTQMYKYYVSSNKKGNIVIKITRLNR